MCFLGYIPLDKLLEGRSKDEAKGTRRDLCPFCPIIKKTTWWSYDEILSIVVCTDLNPRGHKYRLLAVGSGKTWHKPWENYSEEEKQAITDALMEVIQQHIKEGRGEFVPTIDAIHFSIPKHGHLQANMR